MGVAWGGQVLEAVIRYRWISLAPELRDGVKNYLSNLTIKLASDESIFRRDRALVSKVNVLLVQVRVPFPHAARGCGQSRLPSTFAE